MYKKILKTEHTNTTKKIFSLVEGKRKLKLIKYNDYLKKETGCTLFDYKRFAAKYIVYDEPTKREGKIYLA